MQFDVSTTYDTFTIRQYQQILNRTLRRRRIRTVRTVTFIVAIACFAYATLWALVHFEIVPVLSGIGFGVVFLLLGLNYTRVVNRGGKSMVSTPPVTERYLFGEEGYRTQAGGRKSVSRYNIIGSICENDNFYVLMIGHNRGFLLDKKKFRKGTPEEFRTFITEKTGKVIQTEQ